MIKEALYYEKIDKYTVICQLCPHRCKITLGNSGICIPRKAVRNELGDTILINTNYEAVTSLAIDPIEKKPLYNFYPGTNILPYIDAMNIDLKGNEKYYKGVCKGSLEPVLRTIEIAYKYGVHIEVTTLLVTDENTDEENIKDIRDFLSNLNPNIPIHISRYFPRYKHTSQPTSLEVMKMAYGILKEKLNNVYIGNVSEEERKYIIDNN